MPTFPEEPLINGRYPQYSNIEFNIAGNKDFRGITEINFSDGCEPGEVRGNKTIRLGTTDGEYKAEGSMTMHVRHLDELLKILGPQYYLTTFEIALVYDMNDGLGLIDRTLEGVRLKKLDENPKQGTEALMVKVDLDITKILRNGLEPV